VPLSSSGNKVLRSMRTSYGDTKGERVFYATLNKGNAGTAKWEKRPAASPSAPRSLSKR
jgi:hypothetical protein